MSIPKHEIEEMNRLLDSGLNISKIWEKYSQYDYWQIYHEVSDFSLLGKKRMITNRINAVKKSKSKQERSDLLDEISEMISEIYELTKRNGKKLMEINKITTKT